MKLSTHFWQTFANFRTKHCAYFRINFSSSLVFQFCNSGANFGLERAKCLPVSGYLIHGTKTAFV